MGYTHYWYRKEPGFGREAIEHISSDFAKLVGPLLEAGVVLAGPDGTEAPEISSAALAFNGPADCGHEPRDLGITWPSNDARGGVGVSSPAVGTWFAGAKLATRTCGGDCSHESFFLEASPVEPSKASSGDYFDFCKTAYKPYDLAVTAALIVAKNHLGDRIRILSDGETQDWGDARRLCQYVLGYGADFDLDTEDDD